jgi:hypothetical protein
MLLRILFSLAELIQNFTGTTEFWFRNRILFEECLPSAKELWKVRS